MGRKALAIGRKMAKKSQEGATNPGRNTKHRTGKKAQDANRFAARRKMQCRHAMLQETTAPHLNAMPLEGGNARKHFSGAPGI